MPQPSDCTCLLSTTQVRFLQSYQGGATQGSANTDRSGVAGDLEAGKGTRVGAAGEEQASVAFCLSRLLLSPFREGFQIVVNAYFVCRFMVAACGCMWWFEFSGMSELLPAPTTSSDSNGGITASNTCLTTSTVTGHHRQGSRKTEARYGQLYEARINPFTQFSQRERQRKYQELTVAEKITLNTTRMFLGNKFARRVGSAFPRVPPGVSIETLRQDFGVFSDLRVSLVVRLFDVWHVSPIASSHALPNVFRPSK